MNIGWEDLPALFPALDQPGRWLPLLQRHAAILRSEAPRVRVSSVPPEEEVRRHYAESLEIARLAGMDGLPGRLVDVGSGGGFPGMVIAITDPDRDVVLIEPLKKRAGLLVRVVEELGLSNVRVVASRAEDAARTDLRESARFVTARAVAGMRVLLEYTAPFALSGGLIVLPKGSGAAAELTAAGRSQEALGCALQSLAPMRPDISDHGVVALFEKTGPTPGTYPRRTGVPTRKPL